MELYDLFYIRDKNEEVFLVNKATDGYWMQEDFTLDSYDGTNSNSMTISEDELIEGIETGVYIIIPEREGWTDFTDIDFHDLEDELTYRFYN